MSPVGGNLGRPSPAAVDESGTLIARNHVQEVARRALALIASPCTLPADRALLLETTRELGPQAAAQLALLLPTMESNAAAMADLIALIEDAEADLRAQSVPFAEAFGTFATLEEAVGRLETLRALQLQVDRNAYLKACIDARYGTPRLHHRPLGHYGARPHGHPSALRPRRRHRGAARLRVGCGRPHAAGGRAAWRHRGSGRRRGRDHGGGSWRGAHRATPRRPARLLRRLRRDRGGSGRLRHHQHCALQGRTRYRLLPRDASRRRRRGAGGNGGARRNPRLQRISPGQG